MHYKNIIMINAINLNWHHRYGVSCIIRVIAMTVTPKKTNKITLSNHLDTLNK